MRKILVTGAAGRVGANVVKALSDNGEDVRAVVLPNDRFQSKLKGMPGVEIFEADLTKMDDVRAAVKGVTHIIHLAALLTRGNTDFDVMYEINAFATLRLALAAAAEQGTLQKFLLASTDGTYGPAFPYCKKPLKEEYPQFPADHYGTGKYLGEVIIKNLAYQYEFALTIVRFSSIVSPEEIIVHFRYEELKSILAFQAKGRDSHVWPLFVGKPDMMKILDQYDGTGNPAVIPVGPEGEWIMHNCDVRDITQGVIRAFYQKEAEGQDFLIAGPEPTPFSKAADLYLKYGLVDRIMTVELPVTWDLSMDTTKAREVLGYKPKYNVEAMIQTYLATRNGEEKDYIPARGGAVYANPFAANLKTENS